MEKLIEVDESSLTDSTKAKEEEFRSFIEMPNETDGENRNPKERKSIIGTALQETKAMIGAGILNVPYIFKTLGIFFSLGASILFSIVTVFSTYYLLRTKDITKRYSYSVYSRLTMGTIGSVFCRFAFIIKSISLCYVNLKIF